MGTFGIVNALEVTSLPQGNGREGRPLEAGSCSLGAAAEWSNIVLGASGAAVGAFRHPVPGALLVEGDVEHLPFARGSTSRARSSMAHLLVPPLRLPMALWDLHRVLAVGALLEFRALARDDPGDAGPREQVGGRCFARWPPGRLVDVMAGAGFTVELESVTVSGDEIQLRAVRARTLADTVGAGMRLLVCGVNPSIYSADFGVGYARPGNRFWKAALGAGIVGRDRDPADAVTAYRVGMTDFVKRPTRTAAEVTPDEYRAGFARVERLVEWLRPGAVCFTGLSGWRTVVNPKAAPGLQPEPIGGRPAYVMPSTSGLNARTSVDELSEHLLVAWMSAEAG